MGGPSLPSKKDSYHRPISTKEKDTASDRIPVTIKRTRERKAYQTSCKVPTKSIKKVVHHKKGEAFRQQRRNALGRLGGWVRISRCIKARAELRSVAPETWRGGGGEKMGSISRGGDRRVKIRRVEDRHVVFQFSYVKRIWSARCVTEPPERKAQDQNKWK